jgi:hypothetical protein
MPPVAATDFENPSRRRQAAKAYPEVHDVSLAQAWRIAGAQPSTAASGAQAPARLPEIDPISTSFPQRLVRGRSVSSGRARSLLWKERKLFEWSAFIWPIEDFPLIRHGAGGGAYTAEAGNRILRTNARFKRHLLRARDSWATASREIEADLMVSRDPHDWWGAAR